MLTSGNRYPVEAALVKLIAPRLLQCLENLHGLNAAGTKLNLRIQLSEVNLCLIDGYLPVVQKDIIRQL